MIFVTKMNGEVVLLNNDLIETIEEYIKKDKSFEAGQKYEDLIDASKKHEGMNYKILFLEAEEGGRKVLRMIFPEKDGGFDGPLSEQLKGCVIPNDLILSA